MNGTQNPQPANSQTAAHQAQQAALRQKALAMQKNKSLLKKIALGAAALLVLIALYFVYTTMVATGGVKRGQYQAVFLTNGQVYFGKLQNPDSKYLTLTDVYYLQVENSPQEGQDPAQQTQGEPKLIKLGEELHGPEDEMKILQDQVSFWENLKEDSKVVTAIGEYKKE